MRVGNSSMGDGAYQFHATRLTLVMASLGVDTVKTLIHRLRKQYLAAVREQARTCSDPAEIEEEIHALCEGSTSAEGRLRS